MLVNTGMTLVKAKRRAAEMFDEENPWFKEGSTRGKVYVTIHGRKLTHQSKVQNVRLPLGV